MGVYTRFKRNPEGFRQLIELLETTPVSRRQKMIEVGMQEDPAYTEKALKYMLTFEDVMNLPEMELAELLAKAPAKMSAFAIKRATEEVQQRFVRCSKPQVAAEIKDCLQMDVGLKEIGGAQLKLIETTRQLERVGYIKTKRIPLNPA